MTDQENLTTILTFLCPPDSEALKEAFQHALSDVTLHNIKRQASMQSASNLPKLLCGAHSETIVQHLRENIRMSAFKPSAGVYIDSSYRLHYSPGSFSSVIGWLLGVINIS
jgi:hypothetical protein